MATEKGTLEGTEYDGLEDADHGCFDTHDKAGAKLVRHSLDSAVEVQPNSTTGP